MPLAALGPILIGAAGTSAAATTAAWGAIGAGAMAGSSMYGAHKQASAAEDAAAAQTAANDKALAFQKTQAENDYQNQESTRRANFDQWSARQTSNNSVRRALGLGAINIPGYVPSVDPNYLGTNPNAIQSGPAVTTSAIPANSLRAQQRRSQGQA